MAISRGEDQRIATLEGRTRWWGRLESLVQQSEFGSLPVWAKASGFPVSTVRGYKEPNSTVPPLRLLVAIGESFEYSVIEQIADLTEKRIEELAPPNEFDAPHVSRLHIMGRLETALRGSSQRGPSVSDLTRNVLESCERESTFGSSGQSPYGRWRARLFDIPMGWVFPHVGYHAVEFLRWYGPNRGESEDAYPSTAWWDQAAEPRYSLDRIRGSTTPRWFLKERPKNFQGSDAEWNKHRHERLEIVARSGTQFTRARLSTYGSFGKHFSSMLRHSTEPGHRHIFTQQSPLNIADPVYTTPCADPVVRTIIVAGHASVRPIPIASRLGEALGWEVVDFRTMEAMLTGRRPFAVEHIEDRDSATRTWERLKVVSRRRDDVLVVPTNVQYLLRKIGSQQDFSPAAEDLLNDPSVAIVLLDTDTGSDQTSSDLWEQRTEQTSPDLNVNGVDSRENAEATSQLVQDAADRFPKALVATVLPTYVHWGGAYVAPEHDLGGGDDDLHQFLWHPSIGDVDVRVAYELGRTLVEGAPIAQTPRVAVDKRGEDFRSFVPGSVLDRHLRRLRAITGGSHWRRSLESRDWLRPGGWNEVFSRPPAGPDEMKRLHQAPSLVTHVSSRSSWLTGGLVRRS